MLIGRDVVMRKKNLISRFFTLAVSSTAFAGSEHKVTKNKVTAVK